jgi:iron complex transport system substrate-binding protein
MEHIPQRIVCLQPSASAILASVGQLERVVACTRYCADILPEVLKRPRIIVADSWTAQTEQIVAVKPDLVIAAVPYQEKAVSQILRAGIRFLGLAPRTLNDIYIDIATIAGVVGAIDQGEAVIAGMKRTIENVRAKTRGAARPRVFCEEWGKPIIASQPWIAELVEAAGGDFIGQAGQQTSAEAVAEQNPDVLVAAWCGAGDRVPIEKIIREREWGRTPAAQNRRVFCIPDELLNTPAPTLLRGLEALAAAIHPDRCPAPPCLRQITEVSPTAAPASFD